MPLVCFLHSRAYKNPSVPWLCKATTLAQVPVEKGKSGEVARWRLTRALRRVIELAVMQVLGLNLLLGGALLLRSAAGGV